MSRYLILKKKKKRKTWQYLKCLIYAKKNVNIIFSVSLIIFFFYILEQNIVNKLFVVRRTKY